MRTLDDEHKARLAAGRRSERQDRIVMGIGLVVVGLVGFPLYDAACGRHVWLGKSDLAAGEPGRTSIQPWEEAPVVFQQVLPEGLTLEARTVLVSYNAPWGIEFRLDSKSVGTVTRWTGPIDLSGTRVSSGQEIVVRLPRGYRALRSTGTAGGRTVRFETAP